jgi:carboxymethylenebutenolidase
LASVPTLEDTLGAASFLTQNNIAAPNKIALLGFDRGASRTLAILSKTHPFANSNVQFKAGVALYPNCASHRQFSAPILLLAGEQDHLMTMDTCKKLAQNSKSENRAVNFHIFENATHFYDDPAYQKHANTTDQPLWYASNHYSQQAHQQTLNLIERFLKTHLK